MKKIGKIVILFLIFLIAIVPLSLLLLVSNRSVTENAFFYDLAEINWWKLVSSLLNCNLGALLMLYISKFLSILIFKKDYFGFEQSRIPAIAFSLATILALGWNLTADQFMTVTAFISFLALFTVLYKR